MTARTHEDWMTEALAEAHLARDENEVPIGCIILHDPTQRIIARGHNRRESAHDPTAHAEILAIQQASRALNSWRLLDCTLYVTLEPCPMCAGAIVQARLPRLVYGCPDPKAGAVKTLYQITTDPRLNHTVQVIEAIRSQQCAELLQDFFKTQRALGKK